MIKIVKKGFFALAILSGAATACPAHHDNAPTANLIPVPITQENTKTYTVINVGDNELPAKVTVDTGSSLLVLEQKYIKNYRPDPANNIITMGYGNGAMIVHGTIVYADVTLNADPKMVARDVPILMVPNDTFKGHAGIMGVEMNNQTSVWKHLPSPYNQMMVVDGPQSRVSFGRLADHQINEFSNYQLNQSKCNNSVKPESAYTSSICWATRKIPVTYIFKSTDGQVVFKARYNTVFDTGGVLTHFYLQPIPGQLGQFVDDKTFNGSLAMRLDTDNQGSLALPATKDVKIFESKRDVVNSGYKVFHEKAVLFDARDGIIGFK